MSELLKMGWKKKRLVSASKLEWVNETLVPSFSSRALYFAITEIIPTGQNTPITLFFNIAVSGLNYINWYIPNLKPYQLLKPLCWTKTGLWNTDSPFRNQALCTLLPTCKMVFGCDFFLQICHRFPVSGCMFTFALFGSPVNMNFWNLASRVTALEIHSILYISFFPSRYWSRFTKNK